MRQVRSKNSGPELMVRRMVHAMGYRFRLHDTKLLGKPDLVFPRLRKIIFVHGCFWHRHKGCSGTTTPKSNVDFWEEKFERNVERDRRNISALKRMGWRVLVVWQCQTRNPEKLERKLRGFLNEKERIGGE